MTARPLPRAYRRQAEADALIAEATADSPLDPQSNQRANVVRLLLAAYAICGTLDLPRGWVRAAMAEFIRAGIEPPTPYTLSRYRKQLAACPTDFELHCDDPDVMADLVASRA